MIGLSTYFDCHRISDASYNADAGALLLRKSQLKRTEQKQRREERAGSVSLLAAMHVLLARSLISGPCDVVSLG